MKNQHIKDFFIGMGATLAGIVIGIGVLFGIVVCEDGYNWVKRWFYGEK